MPCVTVSLDPHQGPAACWKKRSGTGFAPVARTSLNPGVYRQNCCHGDGSTGADELAVEFRSERTFRISGNANALC